MTLDSRDTGKQGAAAKCLIVSPKKLGAYELCHIFCDKISTQAIFISHTPTNTPAFQQIYHTKLAQFSLSYQAHISVT